MTKRRGRARRSGSGRGAPPGAGSGSIGRCSATDADGSGGATRVMTHGPTPDAGRQCVNAANSLRIMLRDDIDRQIIALLVADGRATFQAIGDEVGLSAPAAKRRV